MISHPACSNRTLIAAALIAISASSHANTIIVNSDGDDPNANVFGTTCDTGAIVSIPGAGNTAECTLRAAIQTANNLSSATIEYASALACSDLNQIRLGSSLPGIGSPLTVDASTHPCAGGSAQWYPTIVPDIVAGADINFGLTIGADNVSIERMEFGFFNLAGILVDGEDVFLDNVQSSLNGTGLQISNTSGGLVINSTFTSNDTDNVRISNSSDIRLRNNQINGADGNGIAIINGSEGIALGGLTGAFPDLFCQGNSISSNAEAGVFIENGSDGQSLACNTIFSNDGDGIRMESSDNLVGSAADIGQSDLVSRSNSLQRNGGNGIWIGMESSGNVIARNLIGGAAGDPADGNDLNGIAILGGSDGNQSVTENIIGYNELDGIRILGNGQGVIRGNVIRGNGINGIRSSRNLTRIGGPSEGEGNVIVLNAEDGIQIWQTSGGGFPSIGGNFIGTDADGSDLGNGIHGIRMEDLGATAYIGVLSISGLPSAPNVIGFNGHSGIVVSQSDDVRIDGNYIGTNPAGMNLGNQRHGVFMFSGGSGRVGHTVGGNIAPPIEGAGNVIAFNQDAGVRLTSPLTREVSIRGNSIYANAGRGIELGDDGNVIDPGGGQNGPNRRQNYPELSNNDTFLNGSGEIEFSYRVQTEPLNAAYPLTIDFYKVETGSAQGRVWLGSDIYPASEANEFRAGSFQPSAWSGPLAGERITATATDSDGNTSEFNPFPVSLDQLEDSIFQDRFEN